MKLSQDTKWPFYYYYLLFFIVAFLGFLQVAALIHPLKYDIIDQAYPWKYFIGECLQEGLLPLWNPYQLLGSPIHADPQSSAWYPVTWLIGYLWGYNIYTLAVDFTLHIFLAGSGMFFLGRRLGFRNETALIMGLSYMLCGFFVGNAQHFMWIISAAWIPFILGTFIDISRNLSVRSVPLFALAFFMIMTGGYPAFAILTVYLLVIIFIYYVFKRFSTSTSGKGMRYIILSAAAASGALLLGTVVIVSVYHLGGAMTRGSGVTLAQAHFGPFSPRSFISFILPFAAVRDAGFYGTDISMTNAYFGLIPLVLFLAGLTVRRSGIVNLFLAWGVIMLLVSVGDTLPFREFIYHYVPFMDMFRFPALFRIFALLSFIVVAGAAFERTMTDPDKLKTRVFLITLAVMVLVLVLTIKALLSPGLQLKDFITSELWKDSSKSTIPQHIAFQGIIQLLLAVSFCMVLLRARQKKTLVFLVVLILGLDMVMASQLNGAYTVYSHQFRSKNIKAHSLTFPDGFPLPAMNPVGENHDRRELTFQALWRNLNIFHKQVSYEGYNPLHLKGFEELADNHTELFETILRNPLVYLSADVASIDSVSVHAIDGDLDSSRVYVESEVYEDLRSKIGMGSAPTGMATITGFSPSGVEVSCSCKGDRIITLLQNNYYGWKTEVDGVPSGVFTSGMAFVSTMVPAGEHRVSFIYRPGGVIAGFYVSLAALVLTLSFLGWTISRKNH